MLRLGSTQLDDSVENVFESRAHTLLLSSLNLCVSFISIIAIRLTLLMSYYCVQLNNHKGPQVHDLSPASTSILGNGAEASCFSAPVNSSVFCNLLFSLHLVTVFCQERDDLEGTYTLIPQI